MFFMILRQFLVFFDGFCFLRFFLILDDFLKVREIFLIK